MTNATTLVLAPVAGCVAALANPALRPSAVEELAGIAAHPRAFYVYGCAIFVSSVLLIPALFGIMSLLRQNHPWAYVAGGVAQLGMLIAIGDAATELVFWRMGSTQGNSEAMAHLASQYESSSGVEIFYNVGAVAMLGVFVVSAVLWRARLVPHWACACLAACLVLNIAGFTLASKPVLLASYVVMLAGFSRMVPMVLRTADQASEDRLVGQLQQVH
ncbi:MAG TPA: hypothetical protein VMI11_12940 [Actinomycetes bacterium]|nr:hypothetical protein [Actinomycetes bacterium]